MLQFQRNSRPDLVAFISGVLEEKASILKNTNLGIDLVFESAEVTLCQTFKYNVTFFLPGEAHAMDLRACGCLCCFVAEEL